MNFLEVGKMVLRYQDPSDHAMTTLRPLVRNTNVPVDRVLSLQNEHMSLGSIMSAHVAVDPTADGVWVLAVGST